MRPWGTSWYTLPNAEHINAVLLHAKAYPHKWTYIHYSEARAAAREETLLYVSNDIRVAARTEVSKVCTTEFLTSFEASTLIHAAEDAFLALAGWPDCAYMLDLHPHVVRTLAGSGNHAAVLLLPAIIAMRGDDNASDGTSAEGARPEAV